MVEFEPTIWGSVAEWSAAVFCHFVFLNSSDVSTAVDQSITDPDIKGSNPAGAWERAKSVNTVLKTDF